MPYRAYLPGDRCSCLDIFDGNAEAFFSPGDRTEFERFLDAPPGFFGVLEDEACKLVACGGIRLVGGDQADTASLTWGMVGPMSQGLGFGKALLRHRLARLADLPTVRRIVLNTSQKTVGFYLKHGFHVLESIPNGYRAGLDRINLELRLTKTTCGVEKLSNVESG
jgi:ribosomal protein S18 acetylase RimI-like enzyme